jgi:hypothetical protein
MGGEKDDEQNAMHDKVVIHIMICGLGSFSAEKAINNELVKSVGYSTHQRKI